jgi:hypothetical protein
LPSSSETRRPSSRRFRRTPSGPSPSSSIFHSQLGAWPSCANSPSTMLSLKLQTTLSSTGGAARSSGRTMRAPAT